jgi:ABC-2 type transport system ATP-binding protein
MLTYFGRVHGMDRLSIEHRIKEVLEQVKLAEWTDKKIGGFSTGMQRRLAIAKAVFNEPEIVILDEPVLGLDPKGIKDIRELIKQFQAEGMTLFLSSHMLQEVSETCDRVVLIGNGQIMAHDTIENIRNRLEASVIEVGFVSPITNNMVTTVEAIQGVESVEKNNGHLHLHFDGSTESCRGILAAMLSSGLDVISYTPRTRGLEEFYLSVIDRAERGEMS